MVYRGYVCCKKSDADGFQEVNDQLILSKNDYASTAFDNEKIKYHSSIDRNDELQMTTFGSSSTIDHADIAIISVVLSDGFYEGHAISGIPEGFGRKVYSGDFAGQTYIGQWRHGMCHGTGLHTWPSGAKYEGDWFTGRITGRGIYRYADGSVYEGDMVDGKSEGWGKYIYQNGKTYEGEFSNDKQHGLGIYRNTDDSIIYSGRYVNGRRVPGESGGKTLRSSKKPSIVSLLGSPP